MIKIILKEMKISSKSVTLRYLCHKVGLEESALEGIMELLVKKGVVRDSSLCMSEFQNINQVPQCLGCAVSNCPIAKNLPKTYSLKNN